jgi:hypothetical protein
MPDLHATEEELILHFYGEPADDSRIADHVSTCGRCRQALDELRHVLALVETEPLPEPLAGLEQRVWARIAPEITTRRASWLARFLDVTPRWAIAGGVAAIVIAAFVAGRATRPDSASPQDTRTPQIASGLPNEPNDRNGGLLSTAVGEHLDQSQMMLLELLNGDVVRTADIGSEQARARDLVAANRLFRHTTVRAGDEGVRELLDVLERVLIEIANAPPDVSARELAALRADIEQRGIIFRLRVVASEMRAREQRDVMAPPTGP